MPDPSSAATTTSSAEPGAQLIGTTISDRYKVESLLGTGGMGAVYLVQHIHMRKNFALKMLHPETSQVPDMVARFEREAMASAHVNHPNIAIAIDFGRAESGAFFLVLEYLEGQRLRDALKAGPMPVRRALHIFQQVASALARSHELGIIHRDLKPENIMLISQQGDPDFVKVLDFGLAKVTTQMLPVSGDGPGQALTKQGVVCGTPKYMAPEQCVSAPVDGRTDLYALGLILFEMLAGVNPFAGKDLLTIIRHQLSTPTPPIKSVAPTAVVPAAVEAIVMRLTDKRPELRYPDATAVLAALAEAVEQEPSLQPEPSGRVPRVTPLAIPLAAPTKAPAAGPAIGSAAPLSGGVPAGDRPPAAAQAAKSALPAERPGATTSPLHPLLGRLPVALQQKPALLLVPVALVALLLWLLLRGGASSGAGPAGGNQRAPKGAKVVALAPQAQLEKGIAGGLPELLTLIGQYPQDSRVQRALAHTYMAQQSGAEALRWLAKVVAVNPGIVQGGEILQAATLGMRSSESADTVIELLTEEFGARGVDVLYALASRPWPLRLKTKLLAALSKPELRTHASAAAAIALELRAADPCAAKRALLSRAAKVGDQRTLQLLKPLTQTHNCGPYGLSDCWACLRKDAALTGAITAIEARSK